MSKQVKKVVQGTEKRVSGAVGSVFGTIGNVLGRARNVAVGTVSVAKDIVTLDTKGLRKDVKKVGQSTVGAVTNVATGAVRTARVAVTGYDGTKQKKRKPSHKRK